MACPFYKSEQAGLKSEITNRGVPMISIFFLFVSGLMLYWLLKPASASSPEDNKGLTINQEPAYLVHTKADNCHVDRIGKYRIFPMGSHKTGD
jgi:hypothetical protein